MFRTKTDIGVNRAITPITARLMVMASKPGDQRQGRGDEGPEGEDQDRRA